MRFWILALLVACDGCSGSHDVAGDAALSCTGRQSIVSSIEPRTGTVSTPITITGSGFGDAPGQIALSGLGATAMPVQSWSDTRIVATVPDLPPGYYQVDLQGCSDAFANAPPTYRPGINVVMPARIYVHNNANDANGHDTITTLAYDPVMGSVTELGSPTSLGMPASGVPGCAETIMISGRMLYASGATGVAVFRIDRGTGALTPIAGSPFLSGGSAGRSMMFEPSSTSSSTNGWLWLADAAGATVAWCADIASGSFTARSSMPIGDVDALAFRSLLNITPYVYAHAPDGTFAAYSPSGNCETPALSPVGSSRYGTPMAGSSGFVLGGSYANTALLQTSSSGFGVWELGWDTGVPTELQGSPFASFNPPSGTLGAAIMTGTGDVLAASSGAGYLVGVHAANDGTLTALPGSPWNLGLSNISCIALSETNTGQRVFVLDVGAHRLGIYGYNAGGIGAAPGSPFAITTSDHANGIATIGL